MIANIFADWPSQAMWMDVGCLRVLRVDLLMVPYKSTCSIHKSTLKTLRAIGPYKLPC